MGHYRYVYGSLNWEDEFRMRCNAAWNRVRRLDGGPVQHGTTPLHQTYLVAVNAAVHRVDLVANAACVIFSPDAREVDRYLLRNLNGADIPFDISRSILGNPLARQTAEATMVYIYSELPPANIVQHFP
jgi:hypothetical protein